MIVALRVSTAVLWIHYLLTERWAHIPGSIHGPKEWWYVAALTLLTIGLLREWRGEKAADDTRVMPAAAAAGLLGAALITLAVAFFIWFPLSTWTLTPFLDDWPPRYQSTREFIAWLNQEVLAGWQWNFLGGYHTSSDVTQHLGFLGYIPMSLFGEAVGFHLLHLLLFLAIPALITLDLRVAGEDRETCWVTAAAATLLSLNYSYFLFRSGDTNSLAGAVLTLAALTAAHAARQGRRWGGPALVCALVAVTYSHAGSFVYALLYLGLDGLLVRDWRGLGRAALAAVIAQVVALPVTFESWAYPGLFHFNNIHLNPPDGINWAALVKKVAYNTELLWLPGRWFNDYGGLANIFWPVAAVLVWTDRSRARLYAAGALVTLGLLRLNDPHFGYAFIRPIHMFPIFMAPVLGVMLVRYVRTRLVAWSLVALLALFVQVWWQTVPHVTSVRDFNSTLVDRVANANGALVLIENNPHRNTNASPGGVTAESRWGIHFESLIAAETGRRLYASYWDGWQWNPWRGQMLGGGTWMGKAIGEVPPAVFRDEMDRWGVMDLFVWSPESVRYFSEDPHYLRVWTDDEWTQFRRASGDGREVAVANGTAWLDRRSVSGAVVTLRGVRRGDTVVVRTNFHPSWTASAGGRPVDLRDEGGQLGFSAPCEGDCAVALEYPKRPVLRYLAVFAWILGMAGMAGWVVRRHP